MRALQRHSNKYAYQCVNMLRSRLITCWYAHKKQQYISNNYLSLMSKLITHRHITCARAGKRVMWKQVGTSSERAIPSIIMLSTLPFAQLLWLRLRRWSWRAGAAFIRRMHKGYDRCFCVWPLVSVVIYKCVDPLLVVVAVGDDRPYIMCAGIHAFLMRCDLLGFAPSRLHKSNGHYVRRLLIVNWLAGRRW